MVNIRINGQPYAVEENTSILDAAAQAGIRIPTLCYMKDLNKIGACRVCLVEIEGRDQLFAACDKDELKKAEHFILLAKEAFS